MDLTDPTAFRDEFFRLADREPPPLGDARGATAWFEDRMLDLSRDHGLHCQNRRGHKEWMSVDHVFIDAAKTYAHFPLIAVEHEDGDISDATRRGVVPAAHAARACVEWAAWKALTMSAQLHVLVAYPWAADRDGVLSVLGQMVDGYTRSFASRPRALFLLDWCHRPTPTPSPWCARTLCSAYVPRERPGALGIRELR